MRSCNPRNGLVKVLVAVLVLVGLTCCVMLSSTYGASDDDDDDDMVGVVSNLSFSNFNLVVILLLLLLCVLTEVSRLCFKINVRGARGGVMRPLFTSPWCMLYSRKSSSPSSSSLSSLLLLSLPLPVEELPRFVFTCDCFVLYLL